MINGCKKKMEYEPQDFFEGEQLEIAKIIYNGDEPTLINRLLSLNKAELNRPAKEQMTLLFWAISNTFYGNATPERLHIITELVRAGADPLQPQPNMSGSPAESVMKADRGIWIKALLDGGLSPNARDKIHNEPIIFESIWAENTETLETMINYHADINIKGAMGRTLLIKSLYAEKIDHISMLLKHGANPYLKDNFDHTFVSLINRDIDRGDKNSAYIKSLEKIRGEIESP